MVGSSKAKTLYGKTGALTSRQDADLLVYVLSTKEELSQNVTEFVPHIADRYVVKGLPNCEISIKNVLLILSIIPYRNIIADLGLAAYWLQLPHYHTHKCGLAFPIASDQSDLLSPSDLNLRIPEDNLFRIAYRQVLPFENNVT